MVTGLDQLFLEVNNLEESLSFYREHLGFELESNDPTAEPPIASVRAGSLRLTLVQQLETMLKRGRGVHFVFGVSDVDQFHDGLVSQGVSVSEPRDEGWGGRFVSLQDPDGYRMFFVTWETPNGRARVSTAGENFSIRNPNMNYQHIENLLIRYRGQSVRITAVSGATYEGSVSDVTNDYVSLRVKNEGLEEALVIVLLHSIESVSPQPN